MRMIGRVAMTTALLVPALAGPADAQNYRWDLGVNGGYAWYSNLMESEALTTPTTEFEDPSFASGLLGGVQLGFWASPSIGLRLNGTYADRPLEAGDTELFGHVNLWSSSLDLLWRFRRPNTEWMGSEILPYLALGLGAKWINPAGDDVICLEDDGGEEPCGVFDVTDGVETAGPFGIPDQARFMGLIGLGTDIRVSPRFGLRLEVSDRIYEPEVWVLDPADLSFGEESVGRTVHEIAAQVGAHLLMGLERPQVVSVAPAPAPPPPPPPPPPAPVEESVMVCVVDPTVANGLRMQSAYYLPETGDTLVTVNGERVPLSTTVGNVRVVRDADWYVRGQPLVMNIGNRRVEYLTYQGARHIEYSDLAFLGTINGYPVFADRDEVADVIDALAEARRARADGDLGEILDENDDLRDEIDDLQYLYVPVEPTGCVFQALQMMEPVQKGK